MLPDTEDETYAAAAAELIRKWDVAKPPRGEKPETAEPAEEIAAAASS
jgi:hypothetical protein